MWEARLAANYYRNEKTGKVTILYTKLKTETKDTPLEEFAGKSKEKMILMYHKKKAFDLPAFPANPARAKGFDLS